MNRVGMIVDCAHTGYRTTLETFVSRMPDRYPPGGGYSNMGQLELEEAPRITEELLRRGDTGG